MQKVVILLLLTLSVFARTLLITPLPRDVSYDEASADILVRCRPVIQRPTDAKLFPVYRTVDAVIGDHLHFLPRCTAAEDHVEVVLASTADAATLAARTSQTTDESYEISQTTLVAGHRATYTLTAQSTAGFAHAAATFVQLFDATITDAKLTSADAAYFATVTTITDAPRYPHRGIMIDPVRHFIPLNYLYAVVRSMNLVHMNVLHMHLSDAQSWPLVLNSHPELAAKSAYKTGAHSWTFSPADMIALRKYAAVRGIRVYGEVDLPGHAAAIGGAYPDLVIGACGKNNINNIPLNIANEKTATVINEVIGEMMDLLDDEIFHIGGDEVVSSCYTKDANTVKFMEEKGLANVGELINYFYEEIQAPFDLRNKRRMYWHEAVLSAKVKVQKGDIVHVWEDGILDEARRVPGISGVVISNNYYVDVQKPCKTCGNVYLYFDTFYDLYTFEPETQPTGDDLAPIVGAEVPAWAEQIAPQTLGGRLWPRAAAVAERYWSTREQCDEVRKQNIAHLGPRMNTLSCRMLATGMSAIPLREGSPCPVSYDTSIVAGPVI